MEETKGIAIEKTTLLWRGIKGLCPQCGQGKLFKSYLKQNEKCSVCGEDFSKFRADDGPAWLTILIVGHMVVPAAIYVSMHDLMPEWAAFLSLLIVTIITAMLILPRAKGVFINVLWLLSKKKVPGSKAFLSHF